MLCILELSLALRGILHKNYDEYIFIFYLSVYQFSNVLSVASFQSPWLMVYWVIEY